jgi:hypothetical protein
MIMYDVRTGSASTSNIADNAITTPKIADGAVTSSKLAAGSIARDRLVTYPINLNSTTITENYTFPSGFNGVSGGPITIADGVTVTITDGCAWSVV